MKNSYHTNEFGYKINLLFLLYFMSTIPPFQPRFLAFPAKFPYLSLLQQFHSYFRLFESELAPHSSMLSRLNLQALFGSTA